jgi:hypothetical protein
MRLPPLVARYGCGHRVCAQGRRSSRAHDSRESPARRWRESPLAGGGQPGCASGAPVAGAGLGSWPRGSALDGSSGSGHL